MGEPTGYGYDERYARARSEREREILACAKRHHDASGCSCDPRYLVVCRIFQEGLFAKDSAGRCDMSEHTAEKDAPMCCDVPCWRFACEGTGDSVLPPGDAERRSS